ncbi:MAG TPA: TauD/TfdA family dioxygenase [Thermoanaerobaculia bacterium]|nr:TauD/TfdA family dioxygenase [Thermoanaerobaculia bacterium]
METIPKTGGEGPSGPASRQRRALKISDEALVKRSLPAPGKAIPLMLEPTLPSVDLVDWAAGHAELLASLLLEHRALLFRGFAIAGAGGLRRFTEVTSGGEPLDYRDRSSPRHAVADRVFTSTDYPAGESIAMHHEGTYWLTCPLKIYFFCNTAPPQGGETPIADGRRVLSRLDPALRRRFATGRLLYSRNYNAGFGLPWQAVFQTDDPAEVERFCRDHAIACEWRQGGRLHTRQLRPAFVRHPRTGEELWFNHAAFFHVSALDPQLRSGLLADFAAADLPYNTYYADGGEIAASDLDAVRDAYRQEKVLFPWQQGDLLMLDNLTIAHGREPFAGPREILVAMGEPFLRDDVAR